MPQRMRVPFGVRAWKPAFPGKSPPARCRWHVALRAEHFLERGLLVRSKCVALAAAHARALRRAGLEARVPGGSARGWAFPGARTFSPQGVRGACRSACACPSACGLGSPRSRENPHRQDAGGTLRCARSISWSADLQSAAGAWRMARRMRVPFGVRAWKPAFPEAMLAAGHFSGARAWKPAFPEAVLAAGHFLERVLLVRSGCVAHAAAHAPALRRAGLEARVPGGTTPTQCPPTGNGRRRVPGRTTGSRRRGGRVRPGTRRGARRCRTRARSGRGRHARPRAGS